MKKKKSIRKELVYTICGSVIGVLAGAWLMTIGTVSTASAMIPQKAAIHHHHQAAAARAEHMAAGAAHAERVNSVSSRLHTDYFNS
jgi:hypothetical protein